MITKSLYVQFVKCKRYGYLSVMKPDVKKVTPISETAKEGIEVGKLARGLFGPYLTFPLENINQSIDPTCSFCEYPFIADIYSNVTESKTDKYFLYTAADIVRFTHSNLKDNVIDIYEVKAVNNIDFPNGNLEEKYLSDVSFQYYVAKKAGYIVNSINLIYLNNEYVRHGEIELNKLFKIVNVTEYANKNQYETEKLIIELSKRPYEIGNQPILSHCFDNGGCPFLDYCKKCKKIPKTNSVLDLYGNGTHKYELLEKGMTSLKDVYDANIKLSDFNNRMLDFIVNDIKTPYINKEQIKEYLGNFKYPLYFFDFETVQYAIPHYDNSSTYNQIPFQYSLHIIDKDGLITHKEYLGDGFNDPRPALIKQMLDDLGEDGTIIAYNDSFEKSRIKELAKYFPIFSDKLLNLIDRFIDLETPFSKGMYYTQAMGHSCSIKYVLPAIFPDVETLNYHNLKQVHHGQEAMDAYKSLPFLDESHTKELRYNILKYCELDTFAMVKIYQYLSSICEGE